MSVLKINHTVPNKLDMMSSNRMCAPKDVVVDNGSAWRLAAIYGEPRWETTWQALRPLHGNVARPWMAICRGL
jgi:hypothetical protein